MKRFAWLLAMIFAALVGTTVLAAEPVPATDARQSDVGFLEANHDYVIQFPDGLNPFTKTTSGLTSTSYKTQDGKKRPGKPATWTLTLTAEIFTVVRLGGGSWALLEHPASADDFVKWNTKRRAIAQLTDDRIAALEKDAEGREALQKLRDAAAREIPTARTWVNLDHAIAIGDVPTEPRDVKFAVETAITKDGD